MTSISVRLEQVKSASWVLSWVTGCMGKVIHLRNAQGIVGHCAEEKARALQRVSAEREPLVPFYTTYNNTTTGWTNRINSLFFHPCGVTLCTNTCNCHYPTYRYLTANRNLESKWAPCLPVPLSKNVQSLKIYIQPLHCNSDKTDSCALPWIQKLPRLCFANTAETQLSCFLQFSVLTVETTFNLSHLELWKLKDLLLGWPTSGLMALSKLMFSLKHRQKTEVWEN